MVGVGVQKGCGPDLDGRSDLTIKHLTKTRVATPAAFGSAVPDKVQLKPNFFVSFRVKVVKMNNRFFTNASVTIPWIEAIKYIMLFQN